jgi:ribosomal protein S18 acetylase RimI-like enzyme
MLRRMDRSAGIRLATPADAAAIAAMSRDFIEWGLGWRWTPARVQHAIRDRATNVAVLDVQSEPAAFGIMVYGEQHAHLSLLAVHPGQRHRGFGAAVLGWLEKCAATAGLERVVLEARADNASALAFYRGRGYGVAGTVPGYYEGRVDAVRLDKLLLAPSGQLLA